MKQYTLPIAAAFWVAQTSLGLCQNMQPRIDELAAGMDDFAPDVEELSLNEIADDFDVPDADESADTSADAAPETAAMPEPQAPKATVAVIPDGWEKYSLLGLTFAAPADWKRMTKPDDENDLAVGDYNKEEKRAIGVVLEQTSSRQVEGFESEMDGVPKMAAKDMGIDLTGAESELTYPEPIVASDGSRLLRKKFVLRKNDFFVHAELFYKEEANSRGRFDTLMLMSLNKPEAEVAPIIEKIVGTVGLEAAPEPEAQTGLDGLVSYKMPLPTGWRRQFNSADALNFISSPTYNAAMGVMTGYRARTNWDSDSEFESPPQVTRGEILGQPASIKSGMTKDAIMLDGFKSVKALRTVYKLDKCLASGELIVVEQYAVESWLESTGFDSMTTMMSFKLPDDAVECAAASAPQVLQTKAASGWTDYSNSRFGTSVKYPTSHFKPAREASANSDGQSFVSADKQAELLVWAGHNALEQTAQEMLNEILANFAGATVLAQNVTEQGFTVELLSNGQVLHQSSGFGANNVVHNARVLYPAAQDDTYRPVAEAVLASLGSAAVAQQPAIQSAPATDMEQAFWDSVQNNDQAAGFEAYLEQFPNGAYADKARQRIAALTAPVPKADPQLELAFWQSIQNSSDPAMFKAYLDQWPNGTFAVLARLNMERLQAVAVAPTIQSQPQTAPITRPAPSSRGYYTPAKGTSERKAIMNAARVPMFRELGQKVIFLVKELRTDGEWCFLMAEPLQPNGKKLNWYSTPYANDWANDAMSNLVMVLMRRQGSGWQAVDHVVGPTDVHWYGWVDRYNLPERLFNPR